MGTIAATSWQKLADDFPLIGFFVQNGPNKDFWHYETEHNDVQYNNIQYNDTQH